MSNKDFRFLNEKCPVCNEHFSKDDDLVVCPCCGTPHHRECYKENTKCANHEKHNEDFRWEPTFVAYEEVNNPTEEIKHPLSQNIDLNQMPMGFPFPQSFSNPFDEFPKEIEEGVKTGDIAIFVRHESPRYLKKFQQIKAGKLSWNWGAFFFAPYWFFYRKLYKLGVIFLTIFVLLSSLSFLPPAVRFSQTIYNFETEAKELAETIKTDAEYETAVTELYQSVYEELTENKTGFIIYAIQSSSTFVISIFIGLNANKWYYKHTLSNVKKLSAENDTEKTREKLFTTGGVAFGPTFLAILVEKAAFMALDMLLSTFM